MPAPQHSPVRHQDSYAVPRLTEEQIEAAGYPKPVLKTIDDTKDMKAEEIRKKFRNLEWKVNTTSGFCPGGEQCNVSMMESRFADDFGEFCKQNSSALPLLFRGGDGQVSAPPLAVDSDITRDLSSYRYRQDDLMTVIDHLQYFDFSKIVPFYIGCSFGAEHMLQQAGVPLRHQEQGVNVAMFKTGVNTIEVGVFGGPMVVSMRHIPEALLPKVVNITRRLTRSHGAPVHIGDPSYLKLDPSLSPDFGDFCTPTEGDVPVFWACGITGTVAIEQSGTPLTFSHSPGQMFLCDTPVTFEFNPTYDIEVIKFTTARFPAFFGLASPGVCRQIQKLDNIAAEDPGNRGIKHLHVKGDLLKAAMSLSFKHASVAITCGFPCCPDPPHSETDGAPGALAIARAVLALGATRVAWIMDKNATEENMKVLDVVRSQGLFKPFKGKVYPMVIQPDQTEEEISKEVEQFDHLIAVERAAPNKDGRYCRMTGKDLGKPVDPVDRWFEVALRSSSTAVVCIGDGGNEVGMAKVYDQVVKHVPFGETIASTVTCDYLISSGVSNWGGYALAASLYALQACPDHSYNRRCGLGKHMPPDPDLYLPSVRMERELLRQMNLAGYRDGTIPEREMSVDSMYFDDQHAKQIRAMRAAVGQ